MSTETELHLWDVDHPYYAAEGNYCARGYHQVYESWVDFAAERGNDDPDLNLVYRWDWRKPGEDSTTEHDTLSVYYVQQRKARCASAAIAVNEGDEPAVRKWLEQQSQTMTAIWSPLVLAKAANRG